MRPQSRISVCSIGTVVLGALAGAGSSAPASPSGEVIVAVASNFAEPLERLAEEFTRETGHRLVISSGSSGKFYAQIRNGAPFDVLLSADQEHATRLGRERLAEAATQFTYAVGRVVVWQREPGVSAGNVELSLKRLRFRHLSIANPDLAPYGAAARQALERLGLWERTSPRLVLGESITQAHQFVASGNAELGFAALSQVRSHGGSFWLVPAHLHAPILQDAVLLALGREKPAAVAFLAFLRGDRARAVIRDAGYEHR